VRSPHCTRSKPRPSSMNCGRCRCPRGRPCHTRLIGRPIPTLICSNRSTTWTWSTHSKACLQLQRLAQDLRLALRALRRLPAVRLAAAWTDRAARRRLSDQELQLLGMRRRGLAHRDRPQDRTRHEGLPSRPARRPRATSRCRQSAALDRAASDGHSYGCPFGSFPRIVEVSTTSASSDRAGWTTY
jgi:hypothetical protein